MEEDYKEKYKALKRMFNALEQVKDYLGKF